MSTEGKPGWAERRLSFGSDADAYDRFRPGYPDAVVRWCAGPDGARVADVGAGTGRFAVALDRLGYDVIAVEPDDGMRAVAETALPGRTAAGSGEAIPLPDASLDAVVAAQAYHWFDPVRAPAEIARVLRPGGQLAVVWNSRDDRVPWVAALADLIGGEDRVAAIEAGGTPIFGPAFGPVEGRSWPHRQSVSVEEFMGLVGSYSYVRLRVDRDEVLAAVLDLVTRHPDVAGSHTFEVPYVTYGFRAAVAVEGP